MLIFWAEATAARTRIAEAYFIVEAVTVSV
jgi:hypothetical protein